MDIRKWFAIDSPKEMSDAFAEISAIYYIAQTGGHGGAARERIERRLESIVDPSEWFASCMCLEVLCERRSADVRWAAGR